METNEKFDLNEFINSKSYSKKSDIIDKNTNTITAIYVISTTACSPCLNEVIGYSKFINKNNFNDLPVLQIVAVIDSIPKRAMRFVKTAEFIIPVIWGSDNKYKPVLQKYGNQKETQQLILYDKELKVIFFRTILSKTPTSEIFKKTIFEKAKRNYISILQSGGKNE